ncbi:MAG: diaminopimelate epimerase [Proteobacteria bacterium]|nr:diaminopimelate epimerase [Pseudomonadota bacterium]
MRILEPQDPDGLPSERSRLPFAKYEGLGNDFVIVDAADLPGPMSPHRARRLCNRHRGVGADGVLVVARRDGAATMRVFNSDGSVPEVCGNGIRCVSLHLYRRHGFRGEFDIDTDAGPHRCRLLDACDDAARVEVQMRSALLRVTWVRPPQDPKHTAERPAERNAPELAPVLDHVFFVGGTSVRLSAISLGNPHVVTFDAPEHHLASLAPLISEHARFAHAVNVGFASPPRAGRMKLRVWERGVGFTQACGSGACAAAVAAVETGRARRGDALLVELPGGTLEICVRAPSDRIRMTGPARHVFDGSLIAPA